MLPPQVLGRAPGRLGLLGSARLLGELVEFGDLLYRLGLRHQTTVVLPVFESYLNPRKSPPTFLMAFLMASLRVRFEGSLNVVLFPMGPPWCFFMRSLPWASSLCRRPLRRETCLRLRLRFPFAGRSPRGASGAHRRLPGAY